MNLEYRHEIPLRWADLDSLNHVNNVTYLRYAADAQARLVDEGQLTDRRFTHIAVEFLRPIQLGPAPVVVTTQVHPDQLVQEIGLAGQGETFARVRSSWGSTGRAEAAADATSIPTFLRRGDLDERGVVSPVQVFELLQESRIPFMTSLLSDTERGAVVLAHVSVTLHAGIAWRTEPLESRVWIERVGSSSYTIAAQLCADERVAVSSQAILVGFDATTQRSRPMTEQERAALTRGLRPDRGREDQAPTVTSISATGSPS